MLKVLKITGIALILIFMILYLVFYNFSKPKSTKKVLRKFAELGFTPQVDTRVYKEFKYRVVSMQEEINPALPTLVFIHGSIGSALDFKSYMTDSVLISKFNMIAYDRIGYGIYHTGDVQESIEFEVQILHDLTKDMDPANIVLVGYSFGGPVALASKRKYKGLIILAGAVYSKAEWIPWMINFYKWKITRWLVPKVWISASKEKISHADDLEKFEENWDDHPSKIKVIHGDKDWIVPFENATYLKQMFSEKQISIITLPGAGHGLIWSHSKQIKEEIFATLNWFD